MEKYIPPFHITCEILEYVSLIMEKIGAISSFASFSKLPTLRKQNRIKSIQSSCAIEANSLTLDQVEDVINGHNVIGPNKDIIEVKNAIDAYNAAFSKNPFSETDLKSIHYLMTKNIEKTSGCYRTSGEGVIDDKGNIIFIAPSGKMVPELMCNLLSWSNENFNHINPLILSSIFHYEFVFIHPFSDGNGRMARLWQNLILSKWKPIFEYIPIESFIKDYQSEYYEAIAESNKNGDSTIFITFMLKMINLSISNLVSQASISVRENNVYVSKLLKILIRNKWYSSKEIQAMLNLSDRANFRKNYLDPAIKLGLIEVEYPDKPRCRTQRYKKK